MYLAFHKENCFSDTYLADFKTVEFGPAQFLKLLVQLREICYPIGTQQFNSPAFKSPLKTENILYKFKLKAPDIKNYE
jgi:hypothetical protein